MLETHLADKATEKRQNFDPSIPLARARTHAQMAWEDVDHKVS
jgi:hypothetical protein